MCEREGERDQMPGTRTGALKRERGKKRDRITWEQWKDLMKREKSLDSTSEERYVSRSFRIQEQVLDWMAKHEGELFPSIKDMAILSAEHCITPRNPKGASWKTTISWLEQKGFGVTSPYYISSQPKGFVIMKTETIVKAMEDQEKKEEKETTISTNIEESKA